jgi:hypothetical protein
MVNGGRATPTKTEKKPTIRAGFSEKAVAQKGLIRSLLVLGLLVDPGLGWLGDAHRVRTGHGFLKAFLKLALHRIVRLLPGGCVFDVRIAATPLRCRNGHGNLLGIAVLR